MQATRSTPRRGFTLLEIMVVVAIMGVLSALAVTGYQGVMRNARTNGEADTLAQFFKNARLRSIATGCAHVVRYTGQSYSLPAGQPRMLVMYRKAGCTVSTAASLYFSIVAPADRMVNTYQLPEMPLSVENLGTPNNDLADDSLMVGFGADGKYVGAIDTAGIATMLPASTKQTIRFKPATGTTEYSRYQRDVVITEAGDVLGQ